MANKSQSVLTSPRNTSMAKFSSKTMVQSVQWDATTLLVLALLMRAVLLLSFTPWLRNVQSFELNPIIGENPSFITMHSKRNIGKFATLHSTIADYYSTTDTARKSISNDEILKGTSKTTQLLLQTPPDYDHSREHLVDKSTRKDKTLYEILGTTPTATRDELKRQYIIMAKLTHPDALLSRRGSGNQEEFPAFTEVADAYHTLSDPTERKKYDRTLHSTQMIQMMVLLGEVCIGTTLTLAEITTTIVWVTVMAVLQPIATHVTNELFYLSIDD